MDSKHLEALRKTFGGPMSEKEIEVLRDIQGFLEFTIRNGLSFAAAVGTLSGDLNRFARCGFSVEESQSDGWLPKTTGYAANDADAVGGDDETDT